MEYLLFYRPNCTNCPTPNTISVNGASIHCRIIALSLLVCFNQQRIENYYPSNPASGLSREGKWMNGWKSSEKCHLNCNFLPFFVSLRFLLSLNIFNYTYLLKNIYFQAYFYASETFNISLLSLSPSLRLCLSLSLSAVCVGFWSSFSLSISHP